jgi:hypothetical protein
MQLASKQRGNVPLFFVSYNIDRNRKHPKYLLSRRQLDKKKVKSILQFNG